LLFRKDLLQRIKVLEIYADIKFVRGVCVMFEYLKKENIIIDITNLVGNLQEDTDAYCEFMKGVILNTSGLN